MEKRFTVEDFRDKIEPLPEFEFQVGDIISKEKLAAYIDKLDLSESSFDLCGRSKRVGKYTLEISRHAKFVGNEATDKKIKFTLRDYSFQSKCNENGIIDCRKYIFEDKQDHCVCERIGHELLAFYDQLRDCGSSLAVEV